MLAADQIAHLRSLIWAFDVRTWSRKVQFRLARHMKLSRRLSKGSKCHITTTKAQVSLLCTVVWSGLCRSSIYLTIYANVLIWAFHDSQTSSSTFSIGQTNGFAFTTLWANSADDKLMIFFLFFSENRIWHFTQIVSSGDNLHEMSKPVFWRKKK